MLFKHSAFLSERSARKRAIALSAIAMSVIVLSFLLVSLMQVKCMGGGACKKAAIGGGANNALMSADFENARTVFAKELSKSSLGHNALLAGAALELGGILFASRYFSQRKRRASELGAIKAEVLG